ncbi:MAG TPA: hypothetical protein VGI92_13080 [Gemmatimonadales bacterium]|jgi:hypothetical protein
MRIFLLSPANCSGKRAGYLMRKEASFDLALRLRSAEGAAIGEVFSFMSGLYFRGKLAYSAVFADPPKGCCGVHVIVPGSGLVPPDQRIGLADLRRIASVEVDVENRGYVRPLRSHASRLAEQLPAEVEVVLLGSIATPRYLEPLGTIFGARLSYPAEFVGKGDMSRGSIMLKYAAEKRQLAYVRADEGVGAAAVA